MATLDKILSLANEYERELPAPVEGVTPPAGAEIASWIDHTLLKPDTIHEQIVRLCAEARQYNFTSVCVNPVYVSTAANLLAGTPVKVCSVVGFPLGATQTSQKVIETLTCIDSGASEIDMVLNIGALKGMEYGAVLNDILAVTQSAHNRGKIVKVILEAALLSRREKIIACLICVQAEADFVKTSTGFSAGGATVSDVDLMHRVVAANLKVKAAGGIRTLTDAISMIRAGASRLGTSAGVQIVKEASA